MAHRNTNLNEYYESLRNNVITLLEHVRIPAGGTSQLPMAAGGPLPGASGLGGSPGVEPLPPSYQHHLHHQPATTGERISQDNFDSYLSKLQTLCTSDGYCGDEGNRPLYETVKSALQDFTILPTPI